MEKNRILTENLAVGYGKTPLIREISLRVRRPPSVRDDDRADPSGTDDL